MLVRIKNACLGILWAFHTTLTLRVSCGKTSFSLKYVLDISACCFMLHNILIRMDKYGKLDSGIEDEYLSLMCYRLR